MKEQKSLTVYQATVLLGLMLLVHKTGPISGQTETFIGFLFATGAVFLFFRSILYGGK